MLDAPLNLASGHLILVEDDLEVRRSLTLMLRTRGYTLDVYRSGHELLSARALAPADCLLLDYKLPGINGMQLLERLRESGVSTPAILITGVIMANLETRASTYGFDETLTKPVETATLINSINAAIQSAAA